MILGQGRNTSLAAAFPKGASWLRIWDNGGTVWRMMNPSKGVYNWAGLDRQLASAQGLPSLMCFGGTPAWTAIPVAGAPTGIQGAGSNLPFHQEDWATFVDAIIAHVRKPDGTLGIRAWELRNETNSCVWWVGSDADLLAAAKTLWTKVKAADPTALVTTPTPCWGDTDVPTAMNRYLDCGFQQYADIVSFHGYLGNGASALAIAPILDRLHAVMDSHGCKLPLWDTESGFKARSYYTPGWVRDWLRVRIEHGIAGAWWYQYENKTNGTMYDTVTNTLTPAGQEWIDAVALLSSLPAVTGIAQA